MGKIQKKKDPRKKKTKSTEDLSNSGVSASSAQKSSRSLVRSGGGAVGRTRKTPAEASPKSVKNAPATGLRKYVEDGVQFLREVRVELKKVTWPSRRQTVGSTAVVLVLVIIVSFFLGIVDFALSSLIRVVLG